MTALKPFCWRCDALDEDGQVVRSVFVCGDLEYMGQQIVRCLRSPGRPIASVKVMEWTVSR